jgi:hypothetical protein
MPDFSYRIDGIFALILPDSPAGEKAMPELMAMTDGTASEIRVQPVIFLEETAHVVSLSKQNQEFVDRLQIAAHEAVQRLLTPSLNSEAIDSRNHSKGLPQDLQDTLTSQRRE